MNKKSGFLLPNFKKSGDFLKIGSSLKDEGTKEMASSYQDDLNISKIDKQIRAFLSSEKKEPQLRRRLLEIERLLSIRHTLLTDTTLRKESASLEKQILDERSNKKLFQYIAETEEIIKEYTQLRSKVEVHIEVGERFKGKMEESEGSYQRRMLLISMYIDIARKYYPLAVYRLSEKCTKCPNCNIDYIDYGEVILCPSCGMEIQKVKEITIDRDLKLYQSRTNFDKAFNKLQGKESCISIGLYEELDRYCMENGIPVSVEVQSMDFLDDGTKEETSLELIQLLLKKTGNKNQYENIPLIVHEYWGWTLYDDLDNYKDVVFAEYEKLETLLCSLKYEDESSSANVQYKLYRLLLRNYPKCHRSHFRLPKNISTLESKTYSAYKILGWEFSSIVL